MSESPSGGEAARSTAESDKDPSVNCSECGKEFSTEKGMRIHEGQVHGPGKVTYRCDYCGDEYEKYASRDGETRYCSMECKNNHISVEYVGENANNWQGGEVEVVCKNCGDGFSVSPSDKDRRTCCSNECKGELYSEIREGEFFPWYDTDKTDRYGPSWPKQRQQALERDNYTCQACGLEEKEHWRGFPVHHIIPRKKFVDNSGEFDHEKANELDNLVTLCDRCHNKWEGWCLSPDTR